MKETIIDVSEIPNNDFCLRILYKLNSLPFICKFANKWLKKELGLPKSTNISRGFHCYSRELTVGEKTGLGDTCIGAIGHVTIGNNCSFSYHNIIISSSHDYSNFRKMRAIPVIIGDNVWITANVIIMPGVTIGSNTVIGAGSVVTKDIPSGVFAAGNPCKVIKKIDFKTTT